MARPAFCALLLLAAGMLAGSGCATNESLPKTWNTLILSPIQRTVAARLKIGDGLRVVLPRPQGGADLAWEVVSNSDEVLKQLTPLYPTEGAPGPDPSGGTTVSFAVVDDGGSVLRFVALRPSARSSETTDAYEIDVTAKP